MGMASYRGQVGALYGLENGVRLGDEGTSREASVVGTVVPMSGVGGRDCSVRSGRSRSSKAPSILSARSRSHGSDRSAATAGSEKESEAAGKARCDATLPEPVAEDAASAAEITQEEGHLANESAATKNEVPATDKSAEEPGTSSSEAGAAKENVGGCAA